MSDVWLAIGTPHSRINRYIKRPRDDIHAPVIRGVWKSAVCAKLPSNLCHVFGQNFSLAGIRFLHRTISEASRSLIPTLMSEGRSLFWYGDELDHGSDG